MYRQCNTNMVRTLNLKNLIKSCYDLNSIKQQVTNKQIIDDKHIISISISTRKAIWQNIKNQ